MQDTPKGTRPWAGCLRAVSFCLFAACFALSGCRTNHAAGIHPNRLDTEDWEHMKLWYRQPAKEWTEALPVGNGRLGAVVFGTVATEHLQLNEDTVWAGHPLERDRAGAYQYLDQARRLIFEGKYTDAQRLVQREFMGERLIRSYQTLGDLTLQFPEAPTVTDYRRELDLDTAIASVGYKSGEVRFTREVFSSPVDQCIVVRLSSDRPGQITFDANLSRPRIVPFASSLRTGS
jgi:alpha-L-fucosidase 2